MTDLAKSRTPRDYRELLRTGRWFGGISEGFQDALLDGGVVRTLVANERLFSRGDAPDGLYALLDGAIRVYGSTEQGKEALLTLLEPPGWFGEISMFDGQPRTHDATAAVESRIVHVPQPAIDRMMAREPRWWRELGQLATWKLRLAFLAMEDAALLPIGARLARRLSMMAQGYGERGVASRTVEVSQDQLALMLSSSRQTVNHVLKDLEARGLVRLAYGSIEILDLKALTRLASDPSVW